MSLILDALKRSEQTDSIVSHAPTDVQQSARAMGLRPAVAALILGALFGVGVATWFSRVPPDGAVSTGSPATDDQTKRLNRSSTEQVLSTRA